MQMLQWAVLAFRAEENHVGILDRWERKLIKAQANLKNAEDRVVRMAEELENEKKHNADLVESLVAAEQRRIPDLMLAYDRGF